MNLPNVQSIPENPLLQVHDPLASQVPSFLQESALQTNSGHVPSLSNATLPGQGVEEQAPLTMTWLAGQAVSPSSAPPIPWPPSPPAPTSPSSPPPIPPASRNFFLDVWEKIILKIKNF